MAHAIVWCAASTPLPWCDPILLPVAEHLGFQPQALRLTQNDPGRLETRVGEDPQGTLAAGTTRGVGT